MIKFAILNKLRFFEMLLVTIKVTKYISELLEIISYIPERFWILIVDFKQIPKIWIICFNPTITRVQAYTTHVHT